MSPINYVVNKKGKKTGVFLSYTHYHRLLEDLNDLKVVAERRSEKTMSFEAMKKRLKMRGLV